jgi:antitoxin HicB
VFFTIFCWHLNDLPQEDRRILGYDIGTVEFGWPVGMPLCRSLGGGLWEIRSDLTSNHFGSSFEDWLKEEGIYDDVTAHAMKRVLAWQIEQAMKAQGITKAEMARRMHTSRTQLDRLLDPNNDKVQLDTVQRAAAAIGRTLKLELA